MLRSKATTSIRRLTRGAATDATSVYLPALLRFGGGCSTTLPAALAQFGLQRPMLGSLSAPDQRIRLILSSRV